MRSMRNSDINPDLINLFNIVKENVETVNDKMTNYKRVKRIKLRDIEFEKTTTRKIRRVKGGVRAEE